MASFGHLAAWYREMNTEEITAKKELPCPKNISYIQPPGITEDFDQWARAIEEDLSQFE